MVNYIAENFATSGNAILRFQAMKYFTKSKILFFENSSNEKIMGSLVFRRREPYTVCMISLTAHKQQLVQLAFHHTEIHLLG
jgi:aspartokinase